MMAFKGVLSSWLMVAMKLDFALLAASVAVAAAIGAMTGALAAASPLLGQTYRDERPVRRDRAATHKPVGEHNLLRRDDLDHVTGNFSALWKTDHQPAPWFRIDRGPCAPPGRPAFTVREKPKHSFGLGVNENGALEPMWEGVSVCHGFRV